MVSDSTEIIIYCNSMKNIILGIACSLGTVFSGFAQFEHRISYTFGFVSRAYQQQKENQLKHQEYVFPGPRDHGTYLYTDEHLHCSAPFVFNFQYDCSIYKHIGVGLCMGYERHRMFQEATVIKSVGEQTTPFGNTYTQWSAEYRYGILKRHILYVMPEVTIYWFKKRHVAMYSKGAIGGRFNFEKRDFVLPNVPTTNSANLYYQISPVAIEVGGPYWRGNIEFGYGAQGIFQYGVRHIFKGRKTSDQNSVENNVVE